MSYSFNVRAATKAEAKEKVAAQLATIVQSQPVHQHDREQAEAAAGAFIDLLPEDNSRDVSVSVNGYVSWTGTFPMDAAFSGASVSVNVVLIDKE